MAVSVHVSICIKLVVNGIIIKEFDEVSVSSINPLDVAANGITIGIFWIKFVHVSSGKLEFITGLDVDKVTCFKGITFL